VLFNYVVSGGRLLVMDLRVSECVLIVLAVLNYFLLVQCFPQS